jgi:hypothetical protein
MSMYRSTCAKCSAALLLPIALGSCDVIFGSVYVEYDSVPQKDVEAGGDPLSDAGGLSEPSPDAQPVADSAVAPPIGIDPAGSPSAKPDATAIDGGPEMVEAPADAGVSVADAAVMSAGADAAATSAAADAAVMSAGADAAATSAAADAAVMSAGDAAPPTGACMVDAGPPLEPISCAPAAACDGFYTGKTAQEQPIQFEVRNGGLVSLLLGWRVSVCGLEGSVTTEFSVPDAIAPDGAYSTGMQGDETVAYTLEAQFDTIGGAAGSVKLDYYREQFCVKSLVPFAWQAQLTRCGDGIVSWPETCDFALDTNGDCSESCQLSPQPELEPNDDVVAASGPISADAVWFGSLQAGDIDFYEINNGGPEPRTFVATTHGPVMGTCGIDTRLCLYTRGDDQLTCEELGHLGECAAVSWTLQGEASYFLTVGSSQAVAGYQLHVQWSEFNGDSCQ